MQRRGHFRGRLAGGTGVCHGEGRRDAAGRKEEVALGGPQLLVQVDRELIASVDNLIDGWPLMLLVIADRDFQLFQVVLDGLATSFFLRIATETYDKSQQDDATTIHDAIPPQRQPKRAPWFLVMIISHQGHVHQPSRPISHPSTSVPAAMQRRPAAYHRTFIHLNRLVVDPPKDPVI